MSIGFILTTYPGDAHLAHRLLWQLQAHHPRAEKIVITDGPLEDWQTRALEALCDTLICGEALGRDTSRPTAWLERLLTVVLKYTTSEVIVKLDADCWIARAIRGYPGADLFGSGGSSGEVVGPYGFRRSTARAILQRGILKNPKLQLINAHSANLVHEDRQISQAARTLGLKIEIWDEMCSRARPSYDAREIDSSRAVWHPVKS